MLRLSLIKVLLTALVFPFAAGALTLTPAAEAAELYLPENTLEADAKAYMDGAETLSETVVMSKDGALMVVYDVFLDTTTDVARKFPGRTRSDGRYYVCDFDFAELKTLRVTERFNPFTHEPVIKGRPPVSETYRIPTLEEAMAQIKGLNDVTGRDVGISVELKEPAFFEGEGLDLLAAAVRIMTAHGYNYTGSNASLTILDDLEVVRSVELGWAGGLETEETLHPRLNEAKAILSARLTAKNIL